jgi:hypothetical protein
LKILVSGKLAVYPPGHPKAGDEMHIHPSRGGGGGGGVGALQNLWETITADAGQVAANIPTDTLGIRGGINIHTRRVGDNIYIDNTASTATAQPEQDLWQTVTADVGSAIANTPTDILGIRGRDGIDTEIIGDDVFIDTDQSVVRTGSAMMTVTADQGADIELQHGDTLGILGDPNARTRSFGGNIYVNAIPSGNDKEIQSNSDGLFTADRELIWDRDGYHHRMGINQSIFTADYYRLNIGSKGTFMGAPDFLGTGINDIIQSGAYTGSQTRIYRVVIDSLNGFVFSITDNLFSATVNSPNHGLIGGELIEITNSAAWNGTYNVLFVLDVDNFEISGGGLGNEGMGANWEITPNTFSWSNDDGLTYEATGVPCSLFVTLLEHDIWIQFGAVIGHNNGDVWEFLVYADNAIITEDENYRSGFKVGHGGLVLSDGIYGDGETLQREGLGTRMIWYPRKGVFRAGVLDSMVTAWNDEELGTYSVAFGQNNRANATRSVVCGGAENIASGSASSICGGMSNDASGVDSFVGGGIGNLVSGSHACLTGGVGNKVTGQEAFIGGGNSNSASGTDAMVLGGIFNIASASYSSVIGGQLNEAGGNSSIVGGRNMKITGVKSFLFGDADSLVTLAGDNTFYIYDTNFIFNEGSHDRDFRCESNSYANMFIIDGGLDAVQIGNAIAGAIADFRNATIVFNENSADMDFRVETNGDINALFVNGGEDSVNVGANSSVSAGRTWKCLIKAADSVCGMEETTTNTAKVILGMKFSADAAIINTDRWISFNDSAGEVGWIDQEVVYNTFTGGHVGQTDEDISKWEIGMVLAVTGDILEKNGELSSVCRALCKVRLSNGRKDKAAIGVYTGARKGKDQVDKGDDDGHDVKGFDRNKEMISYNAVGEGKILVCDTNGNIEIGDYICSSTKAGFGEKQDDDLLHNYTIAKATEKVDWSKETIKEKLIACTYHAG